MEIPIDIRQQGVLIMCSTCQPSAYVRGLGVGAPPESTMVNRALPSPQRAPLPGTTTYEIECKQNERLDCKAQSLVRVTISPQSAKAQPLLQVESQSPFRVD